MSKQDQDYTLQVDAALPQATQLAAQGKLQQALDELLALEKQCRAAADLASLRRVLVHICDLCKQSNNYGLLNEHVLALTKKHGQLKQAITTMVQHVMTYLEEPLDKPIVLPIIDTLRTVTEGKIFVEVERARLTRRLAKMKEDEGDVAGAADVLQELQVETFGSMEKREKTDFILEQVRLCLAKDDVTRAQIISKKINTRYFSENGVEDLKLRYYQLVIEIGLMQKKYLDVCKYYMHIYDTPSVLAVEQDWQRALQNAVLFVVLSPYGNEQSDMIHRIEGDARLKKSALHRSFIGSFTSKEVIRWPRIEQNYGDMLRASGIFNTAESQGTERWKELHKRVIEHNIHVIAQYYTRIRVSRLAQLLDLTEREAEQTVAEQVVAGNMYARIDRPDGIIRFNHKKTGTEIMNAWNNDITQLLDLVETVGHLINKEQVVQRITTTKSSV
jgi:26S proteasome regulatory subunit N5